MEDLKLNKIKRKLKRIEYKKVSKFNFGNLKNGVVLTSTHNPSAHVYNKLIRTINKERDTNFENMLIAFNNGEIATEKILKHSKGFKKNMYKQSVKNANDTKLFIKKLCKHIVDTKVILEGDNSSEGNGFQTIKLCQLK
jgi:hypothetical protein